MTKTLLSILTAAVVHIPCPRSAAHAHPKAHPQPVSSRSFLYYIAVCDARGDDVPRHRAGNGAACQQALRRSWPGSLIAWRGGGLITVAASCCGVAFVAELLLGLSLSFPAKAAVFLRVERYDHGTMPYREKAAARRFLCAVDRPAGFSAEG